MSILYFVKWLFWLWAAMPVNYWLVWECAGRKKESVVYWYSIQYPLHFSAYAGLGRVNQPFFVFHIKQDTPGNA
jgi:hypothetical protein